MSKSAWCDLNNKGDILKLHDKCPTPKCNCQKVITFTPYQYMLEGGSIQKTSEIFQRNEKSLGRFYYIGFKNGNTSDISRCRCEDKQSSISSNNKYYFKIINRGETLSLTHKQGQGLRLKAM